MAGASVTQEVLNKKNATVCRETQSLNECLANADVFSLSAIEGLTESGHFSDVSRLLMDRSVSVPLIHPKPS